MDTLEKPVYELSMAESALESIRTATDLGSLESAWVEFLHRYERIWNKLEASLLRISKYQGWSGRGDATRLRRSDPLLSYLKNARGADQHTVEEISKKKDGSIMIKAGPTGSVHIKEIKMIDGVLHINADNPLDIQTKSAEFHLIDVRNQGNVYPVPTHHLKDEINSPIPELIAELAILYAKQHLERVREEVLNGKST